MGDPTIGVTNLGPSGVPLSQAEEGGVHPAEIAADSYAQGGAPAVSARPPAGSPPNTPEVIFSASSDIPPDLRAIYTTGITTQEDIDSALNYLAFLDPRLAKVVELVRERMQTGLLRIDVDLTTQENSSAKTTFNGRIDRGSNDYATVIKIGVGAGPDILLHEIVHSVPLSELSELFEGQTLPDLPPIDPSASYADIYAAVSEHGRAHEVISFGSQGLLYDIEKKHGVTHTFRHEMMARLYNAWKQAGFAGIRTTFSTYLQHYIERYDNVAAILSLVVKVEGRANLTWDEYERLMAAADGSALTVLENYFRRFIRARGLDVPPDFFSTFSTLSRNEFRGTGHYQLIQSNFEAIARLEEQAQFRLADVPFEPLRDKDIPPADSQANRRTLFVAYSDVVDRILENPPASFDRSELASLVSYVRMVPAQEALDLSRRIAVYITDNRNDLGVTLGLILYDKGLHADGLAMINKFIDLPILRDAWQTIIKTVGPEVFADLVDNQVQSYLGLQEEAAEEFKIHAAGQFLFDDDETRQKFENLFGYPETFVARGWQTFGGWLITNTDVDYTAEESEILNTAELADFEDFSNEHSELVDLLFDLKGSSEVTGVAKEVVERAWEGIVARKTESMAALREVLSLSEDRSFRIGELDDLAVFTKEERDGIFDGYKNDMRRAALSWGEIESYKWWSSPGYVLGVIEGSLETIESGEATKEEKAAATARFKTFVLASIDKIREARTKPTDNLAKRLPSLIGRFIETVPGDVVMEFDDLKLLDGTRPFLNYLQSNAYFKPLGWDDWSDAYESLRTYPSENRRASLMRVEWISKALELPGANRKRLLKQAEKELRSVYDVYRTMEKTPDFVVEAALSAFVLPHAVAFILEALKSGDFERAQSLYDFITREIPAEYPPDKTFDRGSDLMGTWGKEYQFYRNRGRIEWALKLEMEHAGTNGRASPGELIDRVREELGRGGANISIGTLSRSASEFERKRDMNRFEDVIHLMMLKSYLGLGIRDQGSAVQDMEDAAANVSATVKAIHKSSLPDEKKDDLLVQFFEQLFDYIQAFSGADLTLVSKLEGLFTWRTPFMRAGDIPNYERTETLILEKLASVPELVHPQNGKDLRVRLAAFAAAGLPLQRYSRWLETLFDDPATAPSLQNLTAGRHMRFVLERLGLPHPYDIPQQLSAEETEKFIDENWPVIQGVLGGEDERDARVALKVLSRFLGSDLRSEDKKTLPESQIAETVLQWLKAQYGSKKRSPYFKDVLRILFAAGPQEIERLEVAREMIAWPKSIEEKREIFDMATTRLVFSRMVRSRIENLRAGGNAKAEAAYYDLLLSIRYSSHRRGMVSNFFLERLDRSRNLREEYERYLKSGNSLDLLVLAEMGANIARWRNSDMEVLDRIALFADALRFLKIYAERAGIEDLTYVQSGFMSFNGQYIDKNDPEIRQLLDNGLKGIDFFDEDTIGNLTERETFVVRTYAEMLTDMGWAERVEEVLDEVYRDLSIGGEPGSAARTLNSLSSQLSQAIEIADRYEQEMYAAYQRDLREEIELPEFISHYEGLKQDVLLWAFGALDPAQRNLLQQKLEEATTDRERILLFGRAAHFEKLLQLASVHPSVPRDLQELFSVFQEDVPHRDAIDAERTLSMIFPKSDMENLSIDLQRPIKEGTIGGIYRGTYNGEQVVLKLQPEGKLIDLRDSLRVVREIRRNIAASNFGEEGSRALDDFLAFYERVMAEEMDLSREPQNAKVFGEFLATVSDDFIIPEYIDGFTSPQTVAMRPLYSTRLKDLSDAQREEVFGKIDRELIPAMMARGIFHFDLHPGNIGVTADGKIVIYDLGRIHTLTGDERVNFFAFYLTIVGAKDSGSTAGLSPALRNLGTVWDEAAFSKIDGFLEEIVTAEDPLKAIEDIYAKLPQYGFTLSDSYVKLLLMHLTWEGTKEYFRASQSPSSSPSPAPSSSPTPTPAPSGAAGASSSSAGDTFGASAVTYAEPIYAADEEITAFEDGAEIYAAEDVEDQEVYTDDEIPAEDMFIPSAEVFYPAEAPIAAF